MHSNNLIQKLKQRLDVNVCVRIGFLDSGANVVSIKIFDIDEYV